MEIDWRPVVHSPFLVEVPEVFIEFDPAVREGWKAAQFPFEQTGRRDYSLYGAYAPLARDGRFLLPYASSPEKRFVEFHTGLLLHREGFECWSQVQLFEDRKPLFKNGEPVRQGKGNVVKNTLHVRDQAGWMWQWPNEIQDALAFRPRNPDIVARHERLGWRFCEVKGPGDKRSGEHFTAQLNALAVLHLLTGSPVAVVRPVVEGGPARPPRSYETKIEYKRGARLDWIRL